LRGEARACPERSEWVRVRDLMHKYLVIYEKAGSNYSAYSPDLPGCIATGKTRQETEKNIKEAINLHIDGLKEDGLPLPESSSFTEYIEV
jgi:predicted RNase H-like HicB family nuclease